LSVSDLAARRWSERESPNDHQPVAALQAVLRDIEAGKLSPRHIVIVAEYEEDGGSRTVYFQAGRETVCGQMGLLTRAVQMMGECE